MSNITKDKSDRVCVVVGVGEGLGMALALRFAAGYKVALVARSPEVIGKTASEIKAAGGVALPIQSDATVESEIAAAYERINRERVNASDISCSRSFFVPDCSLMAARKVVLALLRSP